MLWNIFGYFKHILAIFPKPNLVILSQASCSVWSLGMILLAKCIGLKSEQDFWPSLKVSQVLRKVISLSEVSALDRLAREFNAQHQIANLPNRMIHLLQAEWPDVLPIFTLFWLFLGSNGDHFLAIFNLFWLFFDIFYHLVTLTTGMPTAWPESKGRSPPYT